MGTETDAPVRVFKAAHALYIAPVLTAFAAGLLVWWVTKSATASEVPSVPEDGWLIVIHESTLAKEYASDRAQADLRFKGQLLQVAGSVRYNTQSEWYGAYTAQVKPDLIILESSPRIACKLAWSQKDATRVIRNSPRTRSLVTLTGKCLGFDERERTIVLENCTIGATADAPR